mgnify:CR=1 FL=1
MIQNALLPRQKQGIFSILCYILFYLKYATPAAKMGWSLLPLMFSKMSSALNRSVWHLRDAAVGLVMPSTARTDLVRVVFAVVGRLSGQVDVLRGDLAFGS